MLLRLSLTLATRRAARVSRGGVGVEHPEHGLRGAARAARPRTRDRTLQEIREFGVDRVRVLVYWQDFAPSPKSKTRPSLRRHRSQRLPGGRVGPPRRAVPRRRRARHRRPAHAHRPGARAGRRRASATTSRSRARRSSRRSRPRSAAATATASASGRSGTSRTTRSSCGRSSSSRRRSRRGSTASSSSPASAACAASGNGADTLLFGETAPRGTPRVVAPLAFLRGALCLNKSYKPKGKCGRINAARLRAPRLHDARRPALPPAEPGRRHHRRALAADHRAQQRRQGRRDHARPRDLLDGVRHPEHARPARRVADQAGRVPRDRRAHGVRQPASEVVLPVPVARRPATQGPEPRRALRGLRVRPAARQRQEEAVLRRVPAAAGRRGVRAVGRAVGPGAAVARHDPGHHPRLTARGQAVQGRCAGSGPTTAASSGCARSTTTSSATACAGPRPTARSGSGRRSAPPSKRREPFRTALRTAGREAVASVRGPRHLPGHRGAARAGCRPARHASGTSPSRRTVSPSCPARASRWAVEAGYAGSIATTCTSTTRPIRPAPPSATFSRSRTFAAEGTYTYHCDMHPYMTGTVYVNATGTVPPSPTASPPASPTASPTATPTSPAGGSGGSGGGSGAAGGGTTARVVVPRARGDPSGAASSSPPPRRERGRARPRHAAARHAARAQRDAARAPRAAQGPAAWQGAQAAAATR